MVYGYRSYSELYLIGSNFLRDFFIFVLEVPIKGTHLLDFGFRFIFSFNFFKTVLPTELPELDSMRVLMTEQIF